MEEKERILEKIKVLDYKKLTEKLEVIYTFFEKKIRKDKSTNFKFTLPRTDKIKQIELPEELIKPITTKEIKEQFSWKFKNDVEHFSEEIKNNFDEKSLNNFYKNITTLEIKTFSLWEERTVKKENIAGLYYMKENRIKLIRNNKGKPIYHELFHMMSNYGLDQDNTIYEGFLQVYDENSKLGTGLNEGYTQLLTERYFKDDITDEPVYRYQVYLAKHIEKIIGKEKMEELYMNADLYSLIKELEKYQNQKEILKFIKDIDNSLKLNELYEMPIGYYKEVICQKIHNRNIDFLRRTYQNKITKEYYENKISTKDGVQKINSFEESLIPKRTPNQPYSDVTSLEEMLADSLEQEEEQKRSNR